MGSTSLQPSIDSSRATDPAMVASSKEKGLRPDQDHGSTHCPRCDSTHTKFCYYNNYSLSQPRYFCKSCRRYWTKGGTLRNIPIGGLCRKNKKISSTSKKFKTTTTHHRQPQRNLDGSGIISSNSIDLQLSNSYPGSPIMEFSAHPHFMFEDLTTGAPAAIDFLDSGGGGEFDRIGDHFPAMVAADGYGADMGNTHGLGPEMIAYDEYDHEYYETMMNGIDVKPRVLALGWQGQLAGCHSDLHGSGEGRNGSSGYLLGFGSSWAGLMNGYGSSTTKPLV